MHGCDRVADTMKEDIAFRNRVEALMKEIREP
jgi:hypothetical protein